jgi:acyl transferase domain-containing protein/phosphopantetheinyl transferase (holo-ACP synthase)
MSRGKALDVAIVGMACRFPGASDLFAFWENILGGVDTTSEVPRDRRGIVFEPTSLANDWVALDTARAAIADAGLSGEIPPSGTCYVVDAASASSLAALDLGARSLVERRADLAIVGGITIEANGDLPLSFQELVALSRSGRSRPFAADADGFLSGEGVGVVVLKRLVDAERDGDRIYAVLKGLGIVRDGRGSGRARAIRRAYRSSGIEPSTVGLIEGHGLGVPAADCAELRALRAIFPPIRAGRRVLGAVSSMIGHAMPAAGMAGLIKTALALHHRVLPPTLHAEKLHPLLDRGDSLFTLNPKARPWIHGDLLEPRRAGVNAFSFAGIYAHAILEEHSPSADSDRSPGALLSWDSEAILLSATDRSGLIDRARSLVEWLRAKPDVRLKDIAFTLNTGQSQGPARLGLVAKSLDDLASRLEAAIARLTDTGCRSIRDARGTYFWDRRDATPSRLAFLFPGEGSQYPGMLADLCPHFPEVRALFDTSDRIARDSGFDAWPSEHLFGLSNDNDSALWSAGVAVNVVLSAQWALFQLLTRLGLEPDAVIGHSSGEFLALAASGVLIVDRSFENKLGELGAIFGRLETSGLLPVARLVAVAADRSRVETAIASGAGRVEVAMDNCLHQVVIAGEPEGVGDVVEKLRGQGVVCEDLPFERAYHTPDFAPALGPIEAFFASLEFKTPRIPIYSCASEGRMGGDPQTIRRLSVDQWTRTVGFRATIETMQSDGINVFVDVGARGNLAGFVEDTLRGRPAFAVAANLPRRSGLTQLNHLVASLFAQGIELKPEHLYARRRPQRLDLDAPHREAQDSTTLRVEFPSMRLSDGLIERLRANGRAKSNGHHDPTTSPNSTNVVDSLISSRPDFSRANPILPVSGSGPTEVGPTGCRPSQTAPIHALPEAVSDPTLLDFQETMNVFLRTQKAVMDAYLNLRTDDEISFHLPPREQTQFEPGPWSGELVSIVEGLEAVSILILDAADDPVAEHHTLGGRQISSLHPEWRGLPVLPFSVMAEMLAEAAARLIPGEPLTSLREVHAAKWIRYEDEPVALEIRARLDLKSPDLVSVSIHNRGPARSMKPLEAPVFEGVVVFKEARPQGPIAEPFSLDHPEVSRFTAESIYAEQWLFHGPALQAVVGIGPISMHGIEGTLRVLPLDRLVREGVDASRMLTDPIVIDNFTHLLGAWGLDRLADDGDVIFPLRMDSLTIHGERPPEGSEVTCRIAIREMGRHRVRVDADLVGPDNRTWMTIRGWEDWRFHWPGRYRDGFRQPDLTLLGEPLDLAVDGRLAKAVWLEPPSDMGRPVWRDVLEHVQMGPDERAAYLALPGPDHRRTHRLWGRIAAKEAVRRLWLDLGHPPIYPADLIIEHDRLGKPKVRSREEPDRNDLPGVSIAHVNGVAVALACIDTSTPIGIDVESIVERSSSFESIAFSSHEQMLLDRKIGLSRAEWIARFWSAKEALAKASGHGFVEGPSGAEVRAIGPDDSLGVRLNGKLAEACPQLSDRLIRVNTARRGDFVWAWTLGERME